MTPVRPLIVHLIHPPAVPSSKNKLMVTDLDTPPLPKKFSANISDAAAKGKLNSRRRKILNPPQKKFP
ncbi:MAG: hypothetical protein IKD80_09145 [Selenomonadaceae bacterium]|nr:hypothetical protein [Selenomonadaceae bacterium]